MKNYIKTLRNKFNKYKIDGYIIPKNDEYFTEYSKINRGKRTKWSGGRKTFSISREKKSKEKSYNIIFYEQILSRRLDR